MSKGNAFETDILKLILQNVALAGIGDAGGLQPSAAAGVLWLGLHTADPGEGGSQNTTEATYTSYGRVSVARSAGGWDVANGVGSNAAPVTFPTATGGSDTLTHFSVGTDETGPGYVVYSGALDDPLAVSLNITPNFDTGLLQITED